MEDPEIACQLCGNPGGKAYRGWLLWCERCQKRDMEWFDD